MVLTYWKYRLESKGNLLHYQTGGITSLDMTRSCDLCGGVANHFGKHAVCSKCKDIAIAMAVKLVNLTRE